MLVHIAEVRFPYGKFQPLTRPYPAGHGSSFLMTETTYSFQVSLSIAYVRYNFGR